MMQPPIAELSDRMRSIFGLVVEAYLERGLPIGSKALAGTVSLSPELTNATYLAWLEGAKTIDGTRLIDFDGPFVEWEADRARRTGKA